MNKHYDYIVIGAGIVGAATAQRLSQQYPQAKIAIVEKETAAAQHQTGRNSGVIHAGVYYKAGSLKAQYCREGLEKTIEFCQRFNIPYRQCGKLIVATSNNELERQQTLFEQCHANDLQPTWLNQQQIKQHAPAINGLQAIWVKHSGITDYPAITRQLLALAEQQGSEVIYSAPVSVIDEAQDRVTVEIGGASPCTLHAECVINCAGMYADRLIQSAGHSIDYALLPFRGEYYRLAARHDNIVQQLIYPVPDPELPFLGVHLTPMIGGYQTVGPNAVLALGREAYSKSQVSLTDCHDMLTFKGTAPLLKRYFTAGMAEVRDSLFKTGYLKRIQRYCTHIKAQDLLPYRAGIRAQAVNADGTLEHDFVFVRTERCLHVGNAPSPAATSALPIAAAIVAKLA
ncbi:L-2-hydroxyglutarate oxidase [Alteromonas sp. ASW11-36]|uniref:L-2-hydroxyglutarate oxidase n=1 Tax=Alteromonas arenosi TaxID=3055817 RepID=A0ABT7SXE8_9ALTE|nr:L-2-hydroxyglutarate oxidase [Alteromonas sp. ASW11-36]MDM7860674.1 L-2-hydroxyglutarate oxidase [Alteromonas sp. ASW11-36]